MNILPVSLSSDKLMAMAMTYGLRILGVIGIFVIAWILAGFVRNRIKWGLSKSNFDKTLSLFFGNVGYYLILVLAVLSCLGTFGIQTTSFAAILGATGLAIGLSFQGTLSNLAAGVMLLIFRPFKIDDVISLSGTVGKVHEINLFTTSLATPDHRLIIFPNNSIFGSTIENINHFSERRVDISVGVAYEADLDQTRKVLEEACEKIPGVLKEPAYQVFLKDLGDSSVNYVVRVWCKTPEYWDVWQATVRALKYALDQEKISIPFPQMDIHLAKDSSEAFQKAS